LYLAIRFNSLLGDSDRLSPVLVLLIGQSSGRAIEAGIFAQVCCHSFRATGITVYLKNKGTLETAQKIAAHESPRTTKLYDRTEDQPTLDEIEKISV
jgi:integrase